MPINYLIIDDALAGAVRPYKDSINSVSKGISVRSCQPVTFEDQVTKLREDDFDGLILDLRLDQLKNEEGKGKKVQYTAQGLAQELRSRMSGSAGGKAMKPVPIILWSVGIAIKSFRAKDDTAQDLFDAVYQKDMVIQEPDKVSRQLIALANGYKEVSAAFPKNKKEELPLGVLLALESLELLDPRIPEALKRASVHEVAQFIHKELILVPGPLIDENILAARLGVDIAKSADWLKLKKKLVTIAGYKGVFSSAWDRWWWPLVEKWWRENLDSAVPLQALEADARVKYLKKKFKWTKLIAAKPISDGGCSKFWTVCKAKDMPLDPQDGIRANEPDRAPWQDLSYLSVRALLDRTAYKKQLRVHPLDKERWEAKKALKG